MSDAETRAYWAHYAHANDRHPVDLSMLEDDLWAYGDGE